MVKKPRQTKYEHLHDLLGKFGLNVITHDQFWGQMKRYGYGQDDIDAWLAEDRRRDDERAKDRDEGSGSSRNA
jgi:hypothetical protein